MLLSGADLLLCCWCAVLLWGTLIRMCLYGEVQVVVSYFLGIIVYADLCVLFDAV